MQYRNWLIFLFSFWLTTQASAEQADPIKLAWKAIDNKNYTEATQILNSKLEINPLDFEAKYLLARAYAWNKQVNQGIEVLDSLLLVAPLNTDYLLSKATFLSWQDNTTEAIALLQRAREINPLYQDIWKLELKLRQRNHSAETQAEFEQLSRAYLKQFGDDSYLNSLKPKPVITATKVKQSIGVSGGYDTLSNNSRDWKEFNLSYSRDNRHRVYIARLDHFERFSIRDQQLTFNYIQKNINKYRIMGILSFSAQNKLIPTWAAGIQINRSIIGAGNIEAFYKHNRYSALNTDIFRLAYSQAFGKFQPKVHAIFTTFNNAQYAFGYILQGTYYYSDKTLGRISLSQNKEVEYTPTSQINYSVTTLSIDGRTKISKNWDFTLAATHHIQGKAYSKNGIYTGLLYRF